MNAKQLQRAKELEQDIEKAQRSVDILSRYDLMEADSLHLVLTAPGNNLPNVVLIREDFDFSEVIEKSKDKASKKLAALEREFKAL